MLAAARTFPLPAPGGDVVGEITAVPAREEDTLVDIARAYDLGFDDITAANPEVDTWLPHAGTLVTIPARHILPDAPREGIVINVAEMRLYYFPKPAKGQPAVVETYPISVGRGDWLTPLVVTKVTRKVTDPVWYPPKALREEHAAEGDYLADVVHPGPDNPLGKYALYLSIPSYLIHGTNKEYGIGMQVTHGCMRLYPEDIETLYHEVPVGTPVRIVYQPYKVGWQDDRLWLEAHDQLEGRTLTPEQQWGEVQRVIDRALAGHDVPVIDWHQAETAVIEANGMPVAIAVTDTSN